MLRWYTIWPWGKLIFYVCCYLHCFRSLPGQLTPITNTHQTKLTLKDGKAGSASHLDPASLFEEWWEERLEKRQKSIASLTLRDCLGFSFQGVARGALGQLLNSPMLRVFRTESQLFLSSKVSLRVVWKKNLNKNFTNTFAASVIFFIRGHWINPEPSLSYVKVVRLNRVYANFPTRIPVILIWESYPTPTFPHIGWTESKINKSDTRLVIFVSKFFEGQKWRRIFSFYFQTISHCFLARMNATYCTCFLKLRRILSIFSDPEKIWSVMARTFATPTDKTTNLFFWGVKR